MAPKMYQVHPIIQTSTPFNLLMAITVSFDHAHWLV